MSAICSDVLQRHLSATNVPEHDSLRTGGRIPRRSKANDTIRCVVLLGGAVRRTSFRAAIGRLVMELPVAQGRTLLNDWQSQLTALERAGFGLELPARLVVDRHSSSLIAPTSRNETRIVIERDVAEFRGTGGVLRDVADEYDDDDYMLVASAGQLLLEPLGELAQALVARRAAVSFLADRDGTPAGVMLVQCGALRQIPRNGFIDFKEQAVPQIAAVDQVGVVVRPGPVALPVRDLGEYIAALRHWHLKDAGKGDAHAVESWRPAFSIAEEGAVVGKGARLHDSVVLRGGKVGAGAVLVRTIVGPGGHVPRGATVVEQLVGGTAADRRGTSE